MNLFETAKSVPILDIVQRYGIETKQQGRRIFCTCPNPQHPDRHPSALLNTEGTFENTFNCFSCHAHGSTIDFVMLLFNLDAKQSAKKIVDDFCNGKYDKDSPFEARKARKEKSDISKTQKIASAYKSIWNAKYKRLDDIRKDEDERINSLEAIGYEMTEEENKDYIRLISENSQDRMQINCIVRQIESIEESKDYDYLMRFLYAISEDTDNVYNELLKIDNETESNYVRGINYASVK